MFQIHKLAKTKGLSFLTAKAPQFAKFVAQLAQQYNYNKGIKMFQKRGKDKVYLELDQLHRCVCFTPISVKDMTKIEKKQAQIMLMLLSEKLSGEVKGQGVYNGKNTHNWVSGEDKASLTATNKGIFVTRVVDTKEEQDMMSNNIPNTFIQAKVPANKEGRPHEKIIICLLYTSPSPRDKRQSRMPSSA